MSKEKDRCNQTVDIKARRLELLEELGQLAARDQVLNRMARIEELHKRINAIDRALGETVPEEV